MADTEASRSSGGGSAARLTERNSRRTAREAERCSVFIGDRGGQGGFWKLRTRPPRLIAGGPRQSKVSAFSGVRGRVIPADPLNPDHPERGRAHRGARFKLIITECTRRMA